MMRALVIGYGKMGRLISQLAAEYNIAISAVVDTHCDFTNPTLPDSCLGYKSLTQEAIEACDIAFDFSSSKEICQRILMLAQAQKPLIVGTTGWEKSEKEARQIINEYQSALLYSPNFSLGIALFSRLISAAAELFCPFPQYDLGLLEIHHRQKQDAPSGTAKIIADKLLQHYSEKSLCQHSSHSGALPANEIHCQAVRIGSFPGTHEVIFDSPEDSISLTHSARNREGFAKGALQAAYWLIDKKGWHTLDDMIDEFLGAKHHIKTRRSQS